MDQDNGTFKQMDNKGLADLYKQFNTLEQKLEAQKRIFSVGEEVQVKGSCFRAQRITPKKLILKLLPSSSNQ